MNQNLITLFSILLAILIALICISGTLYLRRLWVARENRRHALHVRLLRAELMQALARDETAFLIDHWTGRDRKAAFEVSAQLLGIIKGRDRQKLEAIIEANKVLNRTLLLINRSSRKKRVAAIRNLAAFGNASVQGTLEHLMLNDPSVEVRLEAAIAITVAGELPAPWSVIRAVCQNVKHPTPNHFQLFEQMMPEKCDAMVALATMQEDRMVRILAIHALSFAEPARILPTLRTLLRDDDAEVAEIAARAIERHSMTTPKIKRGKKSVILHLADRQAA